MTTTKPFARIPGVIYPGIGTGHWARIPGVSYPDKTLSDAQIDAIVDKKRKGFDAQRKRKAMK